MQLDLFDVTEDSGVSPVLRENNIHSSQRDKADKNCETFGSEKILEKLSFNDWIQIIQAIRRKYFRISSFRKTRETKWQVVQLRLHLRRRSCVV